jgi:polyisoprenoid-binding protein YceI
LDQVQDVQVRQDPKTGMPAFVLRVTGTLTVAGVPRTLTTDLTVQQDADRHYHVQARTPILMTDFAVTPPSAFFGLVRAQDALAVIFNLDFETADAPNNSAQR